MCSNLIISNMNHNRNLYLHRFTQDLGLTQTLQLGPDQASDQGLHSLLTAFSIKNRLKATK